MRIAFVDLAPLDYTPLTPFEQPLGGMQSALCYLASGLAARGHKVALLNQTTTPGVYGGITCANAQQRIPERYLDRFDVVVSIASAGRALRQHGVTKPMLLWTGHDIDQQPVQNLRDAGERTSWDRIVAVSDWQASRYVAAFGIRPDSISVLRNAIAPAFETTARPAPYFFEDGRPPVLVYSSTPFRGLDVLLRAFPTIRDLVPGSRARIYSSMTVYQVPSEGDRYQRLYAQCRSTDGVDYVGSVGQGVLASALTEVDIFAYPNTFSETSCIALMEAMASGCMIVSVDRGALSETAAGFGHLFRCPPGQTDEEFADRYARFAAEAIHDASKDPLAHKERLDAQRAFALRDYSWKHRAAEWEALLQDLPRQPLQQKRPGRNDPCPCNSGRKFKHCCGAPT